ncbi:DUF4245 domain-containing protein [Nocardioides sp. GXZ039]|uniref:DUF4245 domain-containing protein n=1 Tax=Nocardioides sp. GXZ039 TaxID=3136018 RepID=UPI0030F4799F
MNEQQGRPGRYERSFGGLIGAMVVLVGLVLAFVGIRALLSEDVDNTKRPAIDYRASVAEFQAGDIDVVYPTSLPTDWRVTAVDATPVERPGDVPDVGLDLLTGDGSYVGVKVADENPEDLVNRFVDDSPKDSSGLLSAGGPGVRTDWDGWADDGGDHAFTAPYGDRTILVFGAASADELADLIGRLTNAPLAPGESGSATPKSPKKTP